MSMASDILKLYEGVIVPFSPEFEIDFADFCIIIQNQQNDLKETLENLKGIYAIVDKSNHKKYIGSASSNKGGIWLRWLDYANNGYGDSIELEKLLKKNDGIEYAKQHFRFWLLEPHSMEVDDTVIRDRESYWKDYWLTRNTLFGYNSN